jgi:hypothetical protein
VATTLDGTATNVTLSNGNLTATHNTTTANSGARSAALLSSGKYYFEVTKTQGGNGDCLGVLTSGGTYTNFVTDGTNCAALYMTGSIYSNGGSAFLSTGSISNGQTVGVAVDLDNDKVWFQRFDGWNGLGISSENPATNTGGASLSSFSGTTLAPAIGFASTTTGNYTANFGASTFIGHAPDGFTAGWSPTSASFDGTATNATLSNGNLTAVHSNTTPNSGVRSTALLNSGKYYFEIRITAIGSGDAIGILTSGGTYTNLVTDGTNCGAIYPTGSIWTNNASSGKSLPALAAGDVLGIAVDLDNEKIWFRKIFWNGSTSHNPATGSGGASISNFSGTTLAPAIGFGTGTIGDNMTANFGATSYVMGAPSGFSNWDAAPPAPSLATYVVGGGMLGIIS